MALLVVLVVLVMLLMLVESVELLSVVIARAKLHMKENVIAVTIIANNNRKTGALIQETLQRLTKVFCASISISLVVRKTISSLA